MNLDPDMAALVAQLEADPLPPLATTAPDVLRAASRARARPGASTPVHRVEDITIPAGDRRIAGRLYAPDEAAPPTTLYFHGGGWVLCDLDSHDEYCRRLSAASGCAVVSVDYRRAPEAPFPAPLEDCYDALCWVADNGASLKLDTSRLAVAGDSAGGNLAAAVAIAARDRNGPALRHQLLIYPALDAEGGTPSWAETGVGMLTPESMRWYWSQYLGEADGLSPLASPTRVASTFGLPPATVITAEADPLRDEAEAYATRLAATGDTVLRRFDGVCHGFAACLVHVAKADEALLFAAARLAAALKPASRVERGSGVSTLQGSVS